MGLGTRPGRAGDPFVRLIRRAWTEADDLKLRAMVKDGLDAQAIAAKLQRTEAAVRVRVQYIGATFLRAPRRKAPRGKTAVVRIETDLALQFKAMDGTLTNNLNKALRAYLKSQI